MRNLVIEELIAMIQNGVEVINLSGHVIENRKSLESLSNRELLSILIETVEFQG